MARTRRGAEIDGGNMAMPDDGMRALLCNANYIFDLVPVVFGNASSGAMP